MIAEVNGIQLYYEQLGQGKPIVLLHGNNQDHTEMKGVAEHLKAKYTVYSIDSRDHGQSTKVTNICYDDMVNDVVGFIRLLQLDKPIIIGSSDGAIVGLLIAIKYPDLLGGLVSAGANTHPSELKLWFRMLVRFGYISTKDPKMAMMFKEPNITPEMLKSIRVPVLVLAGQRDILPERYTRQLADNISNSTVYIMKGQTHTSYIKNADRLIEVFEPFAVSI